MTYQMKPMNEEYAKEIMSWKYEGELSIYNLEDNEETLNELLSKEYFAVIEKKQLIGFFCIKEAAIVPKGKEFHVYDDTEYLDIGLGMRPNRVNKGFGYRFFKFGLEYFRKTRNVEKFRLTVFDFNKRAIYVYHKVGFKIINFFQAINNHYFLVMTLDEDH